MLLSREGHQPQGSVWRILPHLIQTLADHTKPVVFFQTYLCYKKRCSRCWDWRNLGRFFPTPFFKLWVFLSCNRDPANHLGRGAIPASLNNVKSCDFSPSPATLWLWCDYVCFSVLFSQELACPVSLFVASPNCCFPRCHWAFCHFIPIIRFVLLHISEMKRLVVYKGSL